MKKVKTVNLDELNNFVKEIAPILEKYQIIFLNGEMGSGKTTFVQVYANYLWHKQMIKDFKNNNYDFNLEKLKITSPTFNVMNVYDEIVHIDAYKIKGSLEEYEDYFEDKIVFIEWANNLNLNYPKYLNIDIEIVSKNRRKYTIKEYQ